MKRPVLFVLLLAAALTIVAILIWIGTSHSQGKLHILLLIDTDADASLQNGLDQLTALFSNHFASSEIQSFFTLYGVNCDADHACTYLDKIKAKANTNDVVLFYYYGHGFSDHGQQIFALTHLPNLARADVMAKMQLIPSRHKVVIADCCNVGAGPKPTHTSSLPIGVIPLHDLLFKYSGVTDIYSCKENESAHINAFTTDFASLSLTGSRTWPDFMDNVSNEVTASFPKQHPFAASLGTPDP